MGHLSLTQVRSTLQGPSPGNGTTLIERQDLPRGSEGRSLSIPCSYTTSVAYGHWASTTSAIQALCGVQSSATSFEMKSFIAEFHLKGNPEEPKCGFSKQTVGIFKELEADYGTFDILNDDEVRYHFKILLKNNFSKI